MKRTAWRDRRHSRKKGEGEKKRERLLKGAVRREQGQ